MKAIVSTKPGPPEVLELREVEKPVPADGEVLVRVHASTVTIGDAIMRRLPFPLRLLMRVLMGIRSPKIPGIELAGVVEAVGRGVTRFKPGDAVFGTTTGLSRGANAEYVCVPEQPRTRVLALMPANTTYEEAAAVPVGGMTVLQLLRKRKDLNGQRVLVYGASGSVGTYAVQLAKHFGAEVTGVCSTANLDLVKSLGAAEVIDYTREDFTKTGRKYDVIFDAVGKISRKRSGDALKESGTFISVRTPTREKTEDLLALKELVEAGKIRAVIDRRYPLEGVPEAHRYVDTGRKKGNVVIVVNAGR